MLANLSAEVMEARRVVTARADAEGPGAPLVQRVVEQRTWGLFLYDVELDPEDPTDGSRERIRWRSVQSMIPCFEPTVCQVFLLAFGQFLLTFWLFESVARVVARDVWARIGAADHEVPSRDGHSLGDRGQPDTKHPLYL